MHNTFCPAAQTINGEGHSKDTQRIFYRARICLVTDTDDLLSLQPPLLYRCVIQTQICGKLPPTHTLRHAQLTPYCTATPTILSETYLFVPQRRFMALNDLISEIQRSGDQFGIDDATEHQVVEQILSLMNDLNGEVKNLAVKA